MSSLIGIPADALDYFVHPGHYVTTGHRRRCRQEASAVPVFPNTRAVWWSSSDRPSRSQLRRDGVEATTPT